MGPTRLPAPRVLLVVIGHFKLDVLAAHSLEGRTPVITGFVAKPAGGRGGNKLR